MLILRISGEQFFFLDIKKIKIGNYSFYVQIYPWNSIFPNFRTLTVRDPYDREYLSPHVLNSLRANGEYAERLYALVEKARKDFWRTSRICTWRIRRIWQIRVICGTQNRLRMRGKYLNLFGEYVERIYAYMEMTQRCSWRILLICQET